jgi:RNA polymerase sigma factor (sigma-70 family)
MIEDAELLRRYSEEKSETAFAELVQRHLDFVYAGALRRVGGDTHLAEDVTQHVFVALARSAAPLARRPVLAGWLFTTTRFAAAQVVRSERRRQAREQEAHTMNELTSSSAHDAEWQRLRPVLDDTLDELDERDREAVLLRFFEARSFADIGGKLRLTENAARMRVERALDRLHGALTRRGVTSTTAGLALALANQVAVAAPAGLAASVTGAVVAGVSTGSVSGTAALGFLGFMNTAKMVTGIAVLAVIAGVGTAFLGARSAREAQAALGAAMIQEKALSAKLRDVENRLAMESRHAQVAEENYAKLSGTVAKAGAPAPADAEPINADVVSRRFKAAQDLVKNGDPAEALRELLWCYDVGMPRINGMSAVRTTSLSLFGELGNRYAPALEILRERREKAREVMMTSEQEFPATQEFAAINRALKDDAANWSLIEQLPAGDRRRGTLASTSYDYLVGNQHYREAIEGRSYASISSMFEMMSNRELPADTPNREGARQSGVTYLVTSTAKSIEALAGAGDLDNARKLAERLFAFDHSESTRAMVQQHLERAGQPALLAPAATH